MIQACVSSSGCRIRPSKELFKKHIQPVSASKAHILFSPTFTFEKSKEILMQCVTKGEGKVKISHAGEGHSCIINSVAGFMSCCLDLLANLKDGLG